MMSVTCCGVNRVDSERTAERRSGLVMSVWVGGVHIARKSRR